MCVLLGSVRHVGEQQRAYFTLSSAPGQEEVEREGKQPLFPSANQVSVWVIKAVTVGPSELVTVAETFCISLPFSPLFLLFFVMQVQKPQMTNVPSKAITTKQKIKPTEMLSVKNYSHFIKLCLYQGDTAKPTDGSAMWPEKCNCINKAALRCRATLFIFVKIPHCYSIPCLSASLLSVHSAFPLEIRHMLPRSLQLYELNVHPRNP